MSRRVYVLESGVATHVDASEVTPGDVLLDVEGMSSSEYVALETLLAARGCAIGGDGTVVEVEECLSEEEIAAILVYAALGPATEWDEESGR